MSITRINIIYLFTAVFLLTMHIKIDNAFPQADYNLAREKIELDEHKIKKVISIFYGENYPISNMENATGFYSRYRGSGVFHDQNNNGSFYRVHYFPNNFYRTEKGVVRLDGFRFTLWEKYYNEAKCKFSGYPGCLGESIHYVKLLTDKKVNGDIIADPNLIELAYDIEDKALAFLLNIARMDIKKLISGRILEFNGGEYEIKQGVNFKNAYADLNKVPNFHPCMFYLGLANDKRREYAIKYRTKEANDCRENLNLYIRIIDMENKKYRLRLELKNELVP